MKPTDRFIDVRARITQSEHPLLFAAIHQAVGDGSTRAAAAALRRLAEFGVLYQAKVLTLPEFAIHREAQEGRDPEAPAAASNQSPAPASVPAAHTVPPPIAQPPSPQINPVPDVAGTPPPPQAVVEPSTSAPPVAPSPAQAAAPLAPRPAGDRPARRALLIDGG